VCAVSLNVVAPRCHSLSLKNITTCSSMVSSVLATPFFASIARNMLRVQSVIRAAYRAVPSPTKAIFTSGGKRYDDNDNDLSRSQTSLSTILQRAETSRTFQSTFSTGAKRSRAQPFPLKS
jgi:hypothetical protein